MTQPTVSDVLRRAAQIHAERGGCKGRYMDPPTGRVCALGALRLAVSRTSPLYNYAWSALEHGVVPSGYCLATWNDLPETTDEDVQKFLLRTADEAEFSS